MRVYGYTAFNLCVTGLEGCGVQAYGVWGIAICVISPLRTLYFHGRLNHSGSEA